MNYKRGIAVNRFDFRRTDNGLLPGVTHGRDLLPVVIQKALTVPGRMFIGDVRVRLFASRGVEIKPRFRVNLIRGL